jgi:hypothetical protein
MKTPDREKTPSNILNEPVPMAGLAACSDKPQKTIKLAHRKSINDYASASKDQAESIMASVSEAFRKNDKFR